MSAFLGGLLSALWPYLAAAGAALVALLTAYGKGRSDQKSKTETKDLRDANDIRKQGADALALPLLLTGCVTTTGGGETRAALCDQFRPVRWSVSARTRRSPRTSRTTPSACASAGGRLAHDRPSLAFGRPLQLEPPVRMDHGGWAVADRLHPGAPRRLARPGNAACAAKNGASEEATAVTLACIARCARSLISPMASCPSTGR